MEGLSCRVGEVGCRMVIYLDEECRTYKTVSNFVVSITQEVEAGSNSGYLCDVYYYSGEKLG